MEKKDNIIGIDLGGTNIRAGMVIGNEIVKVAKSSTPADGSEQEVLDAMCEVIDPCFDELTSGIGVGVPSVVDTANGIVYDVVNIPSWKEVHLGRFLTEKYKVPVYVNNDANCFVAGEKMYGKGKPFQNIVGMTVGTGMGLGLVIHGKLYDGRNCCAGEFGMVSYRDNVVEHYCSGQFFEEVKQTSAALEFEKALKGDQKALDMFREFGSHMGTAIKSILYAYDPEIIIMGGSLTKAFDFFKESMYESIQDFEFTPTLRNLKIEISELDEPAILGAAALFFNARQ